MGPNTEKIIKEKDEKIQQLEAKVRELEKKLRYYEIKEVYQGLVPEEFLQKLMELPPEMMVIEIGRYFRERSAESMGSEKVSKNMKEINRAISELKSIEMKLNGIKAKLGIDLNFAQKYDFNGSEVAFLGEDIMKSLGISEGDYIIVQKEGGATLRVLPYSKPGFVVVPTWVRERIKAKVNDFVEVIRR